MSTKLTRTSIILLKRFRLLIRGLFKGTYKHQPVYHCLWYYRYTKGKKGLIRQIKEMITLAFYWEDFPYTYFEYSMFLKSNRMSMTEMKTYVPQTILDKTVNNNSKYMTLTEDKAVFSDLLSHYDIPQPEMIFKFYKGVFYNMKNMPLTEEQVDNRILSLTYDRLFLKDSLGSEGIGIHAFSGTGKTGYFEGPVKLTAEYVKQHYSSNKMILQEGLVQDYQLVVMNPHCLNTFRVLTRNHKGKVRIIAAFLKLGRYGNLVDNVSQGGMIIPIDIRDGSLDINAKLFYDTSEITSHPETNYGFKGKKIGRWGEVIELVEKVATAFFPLEYVGWDVALTNKGAVIIEGNYDPSIYAHQIGDKGLASKIFDDD